MTVFRESLAQAGFTPQIDIARVSTAARLARSGRKRAACAGRIVRVDHKAAQAALTIPVVHTRRVEDAGAGAKARANAVP